MDNNSAPDSGESAKQHWRSISRDPNATDVQAFVKARLIGSCRGRIGDYSRFLVDFVAGKSVLDIGVVQHDRSYVMSEHWKHKLICSRARRVVGIDVIDEEVSFLKSMGYDTRLVDATSDEDLGERFERVVVGDVIEHVNDPVRLLSFCGRHVAKGGKVLIKTPNPFWLRRIQECVLTGSVSINADHVRWLSPAMVLELCHRANLSMLEYWQLQTTGRNFIIRTMHRLRDLLGHRYSELFAYDFVFILCAGD